MVLSRTMPQTLQATSQTLQTESAVEGGPAPLRTPQDTPQSQESTLPRRRVLSSCISTQYAGSGGLLPVRIRGISIAQRMVKRRLPASGRRGGRLVSGRLVDVGAGAQTRPAESPIGVPSVFFMQMAFAMFLVDPPEAIREKAEIQRILDGVRGTEDREGVYKTLSVPEVIRQCIESNPILMSTLSLKTVESMMRSDARYMQSNTQLFSCYDLIYNSMVGIIRGVGLAESDLRGGGDVQVVINKLELQAYVLLSMLEIMIKTMGYQQFPMPLDVTIAFFAIQGEKRKIETANPTALATGITELISREGETLFSREIGFRMRRGYSNPQWAIHSARYMKAVGDFFYDIATKFGDLSPSAAGPSAAGPAVPVTAQRMVEKIARSSGMLIWLFDHEAIPGDDWNIKKRIAGAVGKELACNAPEIFMILHSVQYLFQGQSASYRRRIKRRVKDCITHFSGLQTDLDDDTQIQILAANVRMSLQSGRFEIDVESRGEIAR